MKHPSSRAVLQEKYLRDREHPRVLIVGGCDVHKRIDLMKYLSGDFSVAALGSKRSLAQSFADAGFPYFYYPLSRGFNPLADLWSVLKLVRIFRRLQPDIVHAFATKPCVWGRLAAHRAAVPVIIGTIPGLGSLYVGERVRTRALRSVYERLQRRACKLSDVTIFQNPDDAQEMILAGVVSREGSILIPGSGVRTDLLDRDRLPTGTRDAFRTELGADPDDVVVTMIGRVIRSKGVLEFAEAADRVKREFPRTRFVLVGRDDRESLERLTPDQWDRLDRSVRWLGERDDVPNVLAATDVFVHPSFYREGIPRVLLEAASMELPLVTTQSPGCDEVVDHGQNGFLVEPRDGVALAEAIRRLVAQPRLRRVFGNASRRIAEERFDLNVVAAHTGVLYRELLARRSSLDPDRTLGGTSYPVDGNGAGSLEPASPDSRSERLCER